MGLDQKLQETFLERDLRLFGESVYREFLRARQLQRTATQATFDYCNSIVIWMYENKAIIFAPVIGLSWVMIAQYAFNDYNPDPRDPAYNPRVFIPLVKTILLALLSPLVIFPAPIVGFFILKGLIWLLGSMILGAWISVYAWWRVLVVVGRFSLLVPLSILVVATRALQLYRGIFYTCPSRACSYRGLPMYECPQCGTPNADLWPNLHGILLHYCVECQAPLPTLDYNGRGNLRRRCGGDGMPLPGRHGGRYPERLVAIVGGPASGKTSYLMMAVQEITAGVNAAGRRVMGEIDDESQEQEFYEQWLKMGLGMAPGKTAETPSAFLLHARAGRDKFQLYLYDAPGEEFESISSMSRQQYFPLLEGLIILADPWSFPALARVDEDSPGAGFPFDEVVNSTIAWALSGTTPDAGGKLPMRVAVVIGKADSPAVKERIGDVTRGPVPASKCREALIDWGEDNAVRALEHRFAAVEYFACSQLGRPAQEDSGPFTAHGVYEPLDWVLL